MCGLRGFIRTPWLFVLHGVQVCAPADIDRDTPLGDTTFLTLTIVFPLPHRFYLSADCLLTIYLCSNDY